jgi:hypothetical protein
MRKLALAVLIIAGCGTSPELPETERLPFPRNWQAEPISGPTSEYVVPPGIDSDLLMAFLPPGAWDYELSDAGQRFHVTADGRARLERIVGAIQRGVPARFSAVRYEIPRATAVTLGPLQRGRGAEGRNPFLTVPLSAEAVARIERLVTERKARRFSWTEGRGLAGRWVTFGETLSQGEVAGVAWTSSRTLCCSVEKEETGLRGRMAAVFVPLESLEGGTTLLTFRAHERVPVANETLECRAFEDRTRAPVDVPAVIERRGSDTVALAEGEALGLVGLGFRPGYFELIVLAVSR